MTTNTTTRLSEFQNDEADDDCDCENLLTGGLACFKCYCEGNKIAGEDTGIVEAEANPAL